MNFEDIPEWLKAAVTLAFGAGAAKLLSIWLENKRLGKREYREFLLGRIRELEETIAELQQTVGDLRVQAAELRMENVELRERQNREDSD
jgi:hypothetical protein